MSWLGWMGWVISAISATIAFLNRRDANRYRELEHPRPETRRYIIGRLGEHAILEYRIANNERHNWRVATVSVVSPGPVRLSLAGERASDDGAGNITDFMPAVSWTQNLDMTAGDDGPLLLKPYNEKIELLFVFASRTSNPFAIQAKLSLPKLG